MKGLVLVTACLMLLGMISIQANAQEIIHDAEHYVLAAQHGEKWAAVHCARPTRV